MWHCELRIANIELFVELKTKSINYLWYLVERWMLSNYMQTVYMWCVSNETLATDSYADAVSCERDDDCLALQENVQVCSLALQYFQAFTGYISRHPCSNDCITHQSLREITCELVSLHQYCSNYGLLYAAVKPESVLPMVVLKTNRWLQLDIVCFFKMVLYSNFNVRSLKNKMLALVSACMILANGQQAG